MKETSPISLYIRSYGHLIKLALKDTCKDVPAVRNILGKVRRQAKDDLHITRCSSGEDSLRAVGRNNGMAYAIINQQRSGNVHRCKLFDRPYPAFRFFLRLVLSTSYSDKHK